MSGWGGFWIMIGIIVAAEIIANAWRYTSELKDYEKDYQENKESD